MKYKNQPSSMLSPQSPKSECIVFIIDKLNACDKNIAVFTKEVYTVLNKK
ncbi:hypothetical protein HF072_19865 [Bacillus sp. RO3]|nr:hypothetical protein [Bacillus sp. RO3]